MTPATRGSSASVRTGKRGVAASVFFLLSRTSSAARPSAWGVPAAHRQRQGEDRRPALLESAPGIGARAWLLSVTPALTGKRARQSSVLATGLPSAVAGAKRQSESVATTSSRKKASGVRSPA